MVDEFLGMVVEKSWTMAHLVGPIVMADHRDTNPNTDFIVCHDGVVVGGGERLAGWERNHLLEQSAELISSMSCGEEGRESLSEMGWSLRSGTKASDRRIYTSIDELIANSSFDELFTIEYTVWNRVQESLVPLHMRLMLKHGLINAPLEVLSLLGALLMLTGRFFWNDPVLLIDRAEVVMPRPATVLLSANRGFICPRLSRPPPMA